MSPEASEKLEVEIATRLAYLDHKITYEDLSTAGQEYYLRDAREFIAMVLEADREPANV